MEKQDAHAVKFTIYLNIPYMYEYVYLSDDVYHKLPGDYTYDVESIIPEYFNKEKIEEFKKKICEDIMKSDNPFNIFESDTDYYPIEKDKIWK